MQLVRKYVVSELVSITRNITNVNNIYISTLTQIQTSTFTCADVHRSPPLSSASINVQLVIEDVNTLMSSCISSLTVKDTVAPQVSARSSLTLTLSAAQGLVSLTPELCLINRYLLVLMLPLLLIKVRFPLF